MAQSSLQKLVLGKARTGLSLLVSKGWVIAEGPCVDPDLGAVKNSLYCLLSCSYQMIWEMIEPFIYADIFYV